MYAWGQHILLIVYVECVCVCARVVYAISNAHEVNTLCVCRSCVCKILCANVFRVCAYCLHLVDDSGVPLSGAAGDRL